MSWWDTIYYKILNLPLTFLVKSEPIPSDPIHELPLDPNKKILYVLPYDSKIDLLVVRSWCLKFKLNDPLEDIEINNIKLPSFVFIDRKKLSLSKKTKWDSPTVFQKYLDLHRQYDDIDIQMVPVTVLFGRAPDKEGRKKLKLISLNKFQKLIVLIKSGHNSFVRFSNAVSLRYIANNSSADDVIAHKLLRVARIHFARQRLAAIGPQLPIRHLMFKKLLASPTIKNAIQDEAKNKKISIEKAEKNALFMLKEIAADFNYRALRIADHVLGWAWNKLYQGLKITHTEQIRAYAQEGYEIVYAPCHRSHMDYLLLSYVLYRQGLVPPHIAAGINLNFWPAGTIFRHLGAFFIRRSFRGNKLYTAVFREYLSELFARGYSVEYFVEGGRSRTGRLLEPKTGTLTITLQALLRGDTAPIIIVPVYIGYEHVMEVRTYAKELRGAKKEKESIWLALKAFLKLKKLGQGYVNFGHPIPLTTFLNTNAPQWRDAINVNEVQRPTWLPPVVNRLATTLMESINSAAAVNAMNLCCSVILSTKQNALTKEMMLEQITLYLNLLRNVPYSKQIVIPNESSNEILEHVLSMNGFNIDSDEVGEIISVSRQQAILMTYYRNNIQHVIVIPALITHIIISKQLASRETILKQVLLIYPLLKEELFIYFNEEQLVKHIHAIIDEFVQQSIFTEQNNNISVNPNHFIMVKIFSANVDEILQRYMITLSLLKQNTDINKINKAALEKESQIIAERLSMLHGINSPEFFDKTVFSTLVSTLKKYDYLNKDNNVNIEKTKSLYFAVKSLISPEIKQTITSINIQHHSTENN